MGVSQYFFGMSSLRSMEMSFGMGNEFEKPCIFQNLAYNAAFE